MSNFQGAKSSGQRYIYILELEDKCIYVGSTHNREKRFEEHKNGEGALWTKLHKPIRIMHSCEMLKDTDENNWTRLMMKKTYNGLKRVRGGNYCNVELPGKVRRGLMKRLKFVTKDMSLDEINKVFEEFKTAKYDTKIETIENKLLKKLADEDSSSSDEEEFSIQKLREIEKLKELENEEHEKYSKKLHKEPSKKTKKEHKKLYKHPSEESDNFSKEDSEGTKKLLEESDKLIEGTKKLLEENSEESDKLLEGNSKGTKKLLEENTEATKKLPETSQPRKITVKKVLNLNLNRKNQDKNIEKTIKINLKDLSEDKLFLDYDENLTEDLDLKVKISFNINYNKN